MGRFIVIAVVILAIVGGYMWYSGGIGRDSQGNLAVSTPDAPAASKYTEGDGHFAASRYQNAIDAYEKALKEDPNHPKVPDALFRLGKSYEELGKPQEAVNAYRHLIEKHPNAGQVATARQRMGPLVESGQAR